MSGSTKSLDRMFNPTSVAIIGASATEGSVGYSLVKNLIGKFQGAIYPVNPKRDNILGIKAYPSITAVPQTVDLVIIATPAPSVPAVAKECAECKVGGMVIITAGFKEIGEAGMKYWNELELISKNYDVPIIGPNCLGFLKPGNNLNASFASKMTKPGKIAFISQSGALGTAMLDWALANNIGFSYFVSLGSMIDTNFADLIEYYGNDSATEAIIIYMESLGDAKKFLEVVPKVVAKKPVIVLKVGKSEAGAHAAQSHTGSIAGNDKVYDVAFRKVGVIRIDTVKELFDFTTYLAHQPPLIGSKIGIITNAGGPGVIATDKLEELQGTMAVLPQTMIESLNKVLPAFWSHGNPIDILGDAPPERYRDALAVCIDDPSIEAALVILTPQAMTNPVGVANLLINLPRKNTAVVASFIGGVEVIPARQILLEGGIPCFSTPEAALTCIVRLAQYTERREDAINKSSESADIEKTKGVVDSEHKQRAIQLFAKIKADNRKNLTEAEAKELLDDYGIPSLERVIAGSADEAVAAAQKLGYPIVMKILSPDILHKTDVGGVKLHLNSEEKLRTAYTEMMQSVKEKAPTARIDGVLIEHQVTKTYELLFGSKKDPLFGHVIVFGLGGTAVNLYNDTSISLPPLSYEAAMRMIKRTKIGQLMTGYRGTKSIDLNMLTSMLEKFSCLLADHPEIKEIDINPLAVEQINGDTKFFCLDAKVILE